MFDSNITIVLRLTMTIPTSSISGVIWVEVIVDYCSNTRKIIHTVFPRLIPHPRLVPQCGTIQIQTTLNSMFILIVTHPRIIPHDSVKNRISLLKNYEIAKQSTK